MGGLGEAGDRQKQSRPVVQALFVFCSLFYKKECSKVFEKVFEDIKGSLVLKENT
ncbi:hypothetical protein [Thermoleptolyngbya sp. C42_A2020_037]|uniref:hypothetical protein n=1 Tax=Thermoleptolyngbya sp. C42_A2020_037 TaxID=2747799 RepID=UPI0025F9EE6E|nr:hypothetical protein [Thermoleptolyngbya sp. C42_A2020_037]